MADVTNRSKSTLVDVRGVRVGHAQRTGGGWRTGVTVVLPPTDGAVCGVDVRGAAPGTWETDLLRPGNLVERVHAVVLSGGSAYGQATATGVRERLAADGIGFPVKPDAVVPIVPGAVIFDLGRGGRPRATPDADLGAAAYDAATSEPVAEGSVGAGTGAKAGGLAGGVGSAGTVLADGTTVAALAVVNAAGSPVDPETGNLYAALGRPGDFPEPGAPDPDRLAEWRAAVSGAGVSGPAAFNTVIGVIATDGVLTNAQCARLAGAGHDGLARAVRPAHLMTDGDTIFGLATGTGATPDLMALDRITAAAADSFARAIGRAVLAATGRPGVPSYREVFPTGLGGVL